MPVTALRERGFTEAVSRITEDTFASLQPVTSVKKACELTGKSRATVYRRRNGTRQGCRERRPAPPSALPAGERGEVLAVLDSPRFRD
jgi:putative transposase